MNFSKPRVFSLKMRLFYKNFHVFLNLYVFENIFLSSIFCFLFQDLFIENRSNVASSFFSSLLAIECFDVATSSLWKLCSDRSQIGPCFEINYRWYVFVDFELMNMFQSMKFCVMEDNRLKKREKSFLELLTHGFSYKKHFFSRSAMFTKIPNFVLFLLGLVQNWFVVVLVLRLF